MENEQEHLFLLLLFLIYYYLHFHSTYNLHTVHCILHKNTTLHYTVLHSTNTFLLLTYSQSDNDVFLATSHKKGKKTQLFMNGGVVVREERGEACLGALAVSSAGPNLETCNYKQNVMMFCFKNRGLQSKDKQRR